MTNTTHFQGVRDLVSFIADPEQFSDGPDVDPWIFLRPHHGVRFAWSRLTIRHDADVVAIHAGGNNRQGFLKDL